MGFAAFALLARVLAPQAYGALELAVAVAMVGLMIVDFGLGPTAARIMTREPSRADAMTGSVPAIRGGLAVVAVVAAAGLAPALAPASDERSLIVLYASALLFAPWVLDWVFQGLDRMSWVAPAPLLRMGVFLFGVALWVDGPEQLLRVGMIEIAGFAALAAYYVLAARAHDQRPALRPDVASVRVLVREATPVGVGQLLWALNQYLPTFAIAWWLGGRELAYFGAAHRVVFGLGSFIFLYFFTLYPSLVRATSDRRDEFVPLTSLSLRATAWLGCAGAIAGTLLAEPLSLLAFGSEFGPTAPLLALLVWALPIQMLSGHARFALIAAGEPGAHMWAQAFGVGVTLVTCALLVPSHGAAGAAAALLAAAVAVWGWAHVATRRLVGALPGLSPLWRPAAAAAGSLAAAAAALPVESAWLRAAFGTGGFIGLGLLIERRALAALPELLRGGRPGGHT
jgi:O-antigen/teichoic acid export membrane protein